MKVLHLSHQGLPDKRVERAASTGAKHGHECFFAGPESKLVPPFKNVYPMPWTWQTKLRLPYFWRKLKKRFKRILEKTDPNTIHAHDIFAAKLCHEIEVPFVFDSHELWSSEAVVKVVKKHGPLWLKRLVITRYGLHLWEKWHRQIIKEAPVLTVSKTIVGEMKKQGAENVFWVPNFPLTKEVEAIKFQRKHDTFSCVYIGDDFSVNNPHRNVSYILDVFNDGDKTLTIVGDKKFMSNNPRVKSLGFLRHRDMMDELTKYHVGLLPWKPHPYHYYCLPNKPIEYAHAGLPTVVTYPLVNVFQTLTWRNAIIFDGSTFGLQNTLTRLKEGWWNPQWSRDIVTYARSKLVWERHEDKILEAYSLAR